MLPVVVIPARLNSGRLPGKVLADLDGLPMLVRTAQVAQACDQVGEVIVATCSDKVAQVARAHRLRVEMTAADHPNGSQRVAEVAARLHLGACINLQADEPLLWPSDLGQVATALSAGAGPMVTLRRRLPAHAAADDVDLVKVVCDDASEAMYFSRSPIPYNAPRQDVWVHVGVYGFAAGRIAAYAAYGVHPLERAERLEQLRAVAMGWRVRVLVAQGQGEGVDGARSLAAVRQQLRWGQE